MLKECVCSVIRKDVEPLVKGYPKFVQFYSSRC
jgi:hypothetical protein